MNSLTKHFNSIYDNFDNDFRNKNIIRLVSEYIKKGSGVLDIGCGTGHLVRKLVNKGCYVEGIECSRDMIRLSKKTLRDLNNFKLYEKDAMEIDFLKKKFDYVVCIDLLEHVKEDDMLLKKISKVLVKNGLLIITVPNRKSLYGKHDIKLNHYRRYSLSEITNKLVKSGYYIKKKRYWNFLGGIYSQIIKTLNLKFDADKIRYDKSRFSLFINCLLYIYFKIFENRVSIPFSLSLIIIAQKK